MSWLTKVVAVMALSLWGLAAMHCTLEGVPGFDFLKTCCFADSTPSSPQKCEDDGCSLVERANYRPEEQSAVAPLPMLLPVLLSSFTPAPLPEPRVDSLVVSESPLEVSRHWQFAHRAALPPRAPSFAS